MNFFSIIFAFLVTSLILITIAFSLLILKIFIGKSIGSPKYAPVVGTVFGQIFYFNTLHDYLADIARKHPTFRLLAPDQSELYTTDVRNIEYILKTNFDNYTKGQYNKEIITDLFGHGIFAVDGVKWKQQRKLASHEFSTRVLRDFSCAVFRTNAAKLVRIVSKFAMVNEVLDIHVSQLQNLIVFLKTTTLENEVGLSNSLTFFLEFADEKWLGLDFQSWVRSGS